MAEIEQAYIAAEFVKDWQAAKAIHGDKVCKDLLARTDAQRRADAVAQIYADAAANPNKSVPFNFVHVIVWTEAEHHELNRTARKAIDEGDYVLPRGGPTIQVNGAMLCKRHNRHKERGYAVWRDQTTGQLRIKTPTGEEITKPRETR